MSPSLSRPLQRLAAAVGGVDTLAKRCGTQPAIIWAWMAGEARPTADELFVLGLIANRVGVSLVQTTSGPPPHVSHMRISSSREVAAGGEKESAANADDEQVVPTYEEYLAIIRGR